ncbi:MAG: epoxyqueuosine reductase [Ruminococcaceae bacterium]|nr:epoxyqueuosine reductase [Oscillospiraceae bacterium]
MRELISQMLKERGISLCAPLSLSDCSIQKPYLLQREGIPADGTAFLFAVPYYTAFCEDPARNISAYAVSADYHLFFRQLFDEILPILRARFPQHRFAGFTDHSPIAEVEAAVRAGLGVLGCNHLLLTKAYSSYVFIGEILTDAKTDAPAGPLHRCTACGACHSACPVSLGEDCLSALTQKKGELDEREREALLAHGMVWGCDRCQERCPVTLSAKQSGSIYTNIRFFTDTALPHLTADTVETMTEEAFAARAYSWRGRQVILRNLKLLQKGERS